MAYYETVAVTVGAGETTGSVDVTFARGGFLLGVDFDFGSGMPATMDTTVADVIPGGRTRTLVFLENTATDVYVPVSEEKKASTNGATGIYTAPAFGPTLRFSVAGATPGLAVTINALIEPLGR